MWTTLNWIDGPWRGRLALAARPRGGDWLPEELDHWRDAGIAGVCSLLTLEEERDLSLQEEPALVLARGMRFFSLPIRDREVPDSQEKLTEVLETLDAELTAGRNLVLHCRQGIGRTGLVAACLLVARGAEPESAVQQLSRARGIPVPETDEQRLWIDRYAASIALAK